MSLKRLALLAAVAYHNQQSQQNQQHEQPKQQQEQHSKHGDQSTQNATTLIETQVSTNMESSGNNNNSTSRNNNDSASRNNNNSTSSNNIVTSTLATPHRNINHNSLSSTNSTAVVRPHLRRTTTTTMTTPSPTISGAMANADNENSNSNNNEDDDDVKANDISDLSNEHGAAKDGDGDEEDEEGDMDDNDDAIQDHIRYHQQHHQQSGQTYTTYYTGGIGLFHQQNIRAGNMGSSAATGGSLGGLGGVGGGGGGTVIINGNVNLLLGGAMLSLVTTILCVVCYCCHRNIKKRTEAAYRQQRQWLENDANMEIYSVEQCYETSGLFLGESSDGLATMPPLHHEPPPSYDAVVAMQEQQLLLQQQQQQQLQQHQLHLQQLQRSSPPPGYRSSLDVSIIVATGAATAAAPYHRGAPDGMASSVGSIVGASVSPASDSNGNLCQPLPPPKHLAVSGRSLVPHPILNMKRVLNAQSCCSLQRAEVENMFNAAAAAVAARSTHGHAGGGDTPAGGGGLSNSRPTTPAMRPRKSLPSRLPARSATAAAGRYQPHHQGGLYRRGCPLCGKFRYEGDDDDDEDDDEDGNAIMTHATTTDAATHPLDCCWQERVNRADQSNGNVTPQRFYENDPEAGTSHRARSTINGSDNNGHPSEACSCDRSPSVELGAAYDREDRENGNTQRPERPPRLPSARSRIMEDEGYAILDAATPPSQRDLKVAAPLVDSNANEQPEDDVTRAACALESSTGDATSPNELPQAMTSSSSVDLDTINENGLIRLDMSKIIDKTGLPTYEAALKLESSGYV